MTHGIEPPCRDAGWNLRDFIAAASLFLATTAVVLWQNAHLVVLWDLSYVLDCATRIAQGQMPYRDFPLVHAPLTFLLQAAIIRLTGRVFFHHVLYCALMGGLGTVLVWRIALRTLRGRLPSAWPVSLLLAAPLAVLGIYCILPHPSYDGDCAFSVLIAILLLQRIAHATPEASSSRLARIPVLAFVAGAASVVPLFFKQNIGLPFLAAVLGSVLLLIAARILRPSQSLPGLSALLAILAGALTTLLAACLLLHFTVGLGNYIHWTIRFAAQRRLPGLTEMLGIYQEPSLLWTLPCIAAALLLLHSSLVKALWARLLALALLAAPFLFTLIPLLVTDDADDRSDTLLALWPLLLILAAVLTLFNLRRGLSLCTFLPVIVLAAIHGALMSQQLWGSTYAIWPLLVLLIAEMLAFLDTSAASRKPALAQVMAAVISATLLLCGALYTASEERLSYAQFPAGPVLHATFPQLAGMATPGPYLPEFEELLRFAAANIPASDGLILLPGEDPFYFATGRVPQFPVLLFDHATDPYSPAETVEQARARHIRWLIVKRNLQIKADPTPQRESLLKALLADFKLDHRLKGYDVYQRQ